MIITRTPHRISFFGGGSDYPAYFLKHKGCVLSTTIDKYVYVSCRWLPPFFEHKHRIVWSQVENINKIDEIRNHNVRECLRFLNVQRGVVINHDSDIPARSGMGSSSAFTVGLLNALFHLKGGDLIPNRGLAQLAIHIEQDLIKDNVGSQDQLACAVGGLNFIHFGTDGQNSVIPVNISQERKKEFESHLMLVFTGFPRTASEIAGTYDFNQESLKFMAIQAQNAEAILIGKGDINYLGYMFNDAWKYKKSLSNAISTPYIDFLYDNALKAGAIGGKVLGAGGGGFMLLFCEPEKQLQVKEALKGSLFVPFHFEDKGSQVILNNGNS